MKCTRRQWLGGSLTIAGLAALHSAATAGEGARKWRSGLGLNGFMSSSQLYEKTYPIWEVLDFAAKAGFDGIELVEGWPMGGYPKSLENERIAALKRLYDQYGLRVYTIQTGGEAAYAADARVRKEWLETFRDQVNFCRMAGGDFIGHWPGGGLAGHETVDKAIGALAASYREAARVCADAGMHLSFEIEPPFLFNTLEHLQRILTEAGHPACKTNYDPSHFDVMSGSRGKPEEMLRALGVDHIGHVHLTDADGTLYEGTSKHLPCGDGHCDIQASLQTLWDGGYAGWIMIDAWMIDDAYLAARRGKEAIDAAEARNAAV